MRISGGEWCGRRLKVPPGEKVRPTQDRVREALFSMLIDHVAGGFWLDLFAGSGSVGLDALSRGARRVIWVEKDNRNVQLIRANAETMGATGGEIIRADALRWLQTAGRGLKADVAFADPPYVIGREQGFAGLMAAATAGDAVRPGGLFIAEMPIAKSAETVPGWELLRDRVYGHTRVAVYRREDAAERPADGTEVLPADAETERG
ncbi:MAG: 16S rRNA (guanine(966)-N(2))-methyltransferase RsmD [Kiritimatiellae bacterium]|nr:16S rRNA (guanine(966)-N(2))-methyltransferase RsmD [Kiritimatiellia bacterium]